MLPRTCIILLGLSLLSAAATLGDRSTSVGVAGNPSSAKAIVGQPRGAVAKKPLGKTQGPASRKRTSRRRQRRRPAGPRQMAPNRLCYLYPAGPPVYQGIGRNQPSLTANSGAANPPFVSYKMSLPVKERKRESGAMANKMLFGRQVGYHYSPYPLMLVCPPYPQVSGNTPFPSSVSQYQPQPDDNDSDYWMGTDYPDMPFDDADPGMSSFPEYDEEIPFRYNNAYGSSQRVPQSTNPSGANGASQAWYPARYAYRPNF